MSSVFFTADQHFGHKNILVYEERPFESVEEMDEHMILQWNKSVNDSDMVFVVGDFSFYNKHKTTEILKQLRGDKILIKGNHDKWSNRRYIECGFDEVSNYSIILEEWIILQHKPPTYFNSRMPYFYIYGHVHSTPMYETVTQQSACVSVERWDYRPITIDDIQYMIEEELV